MSTTFDVAVDLSVDLGRGLVLRNPVLVASGTFGYGTEYADVVDIQRLGAICCKGTTLRPRVGNPPPRVTETPAGMLNSIGLQNPGVAGVLEKYAPRWASWDVPVIVNVAGKSVEDYVEVARRLDGQPGVAGIELNISCPNVGRGGLQFALDPEGASEVTKAVREATDLPLMVKLSPAATDIRAIAKAIERAGANSISATNTLSGMAIDIHRGKPLLGNTYGGLSGPALKPVALRVVYEVAQVVDIPIVAIGGIGSLDDALEFFYAGASADPGRHRRLRRPCPSRAPDRRARGLARGPWLRHAARNRRRSAAAAARQAQRKRRGIPAVSEATAARVEQLFTEAGAYREGHFKLKSGRHGDRYIEKFEVLQWPERVTELCSMLIAGAGQNRCGGRAHDGRRHPRLRMRQAARRARHLRRGGHGRRQRHSHRELRRGFAIRSG